MNGNPVRSGVQGIDAILMAHRAQIMRFLLAHGAGDAAEDLLQELWMRVRETPSGPIANPLSYLYRAANNLMIDRARAERQARLRERAWAEVQGMEEQSAELPADSLLIAREELMRLNGAIEAVSPRAAACLRRFRLDGVPQKQIAAELGVSISTVENDLRRAYWALLEARRQSDDA